MTGLFWYNHFLLVWMFGSENAENWFEIFFVFSSNEAPSQNSQQTPENPSKHTIDYRKKHGLYIRFYSLERNDKDFVSIIGWIYKDIISRIGCIVFVSFLQYRKWANLVSFIWVFPYHDYWYEWIGISLNGNFNTYQTP